MNQDTDLSAHTVLLAALAKLMRPTLYVEFGVQSGFTISAVAPFCGRAVGCDVRRYPLTETRGFEFHQVDTEQFCREVLPTLPPVELALIDADHDAGAVLRDFQFLAEYAAPNALICLHDTFPESRQQTDPLFCGDSYRVPDLLRGLGFHDVLTLPIPPGLTIVRLNPTETAR